MQNSMFNLEIKVKIPEQGGCSALILKTGSRAKNALPKVEAKVKAK